MRKCTHSLLIHIDAYKIYTLLHTQNIYTLTYTNIYTLTYTNICTLTYPNIYTLTYTNIPSHTLRHTNRKYFNRIPHSLLHIEQTLTSHTHSYISYFHTFIKTHTDIHHIQYLYTLTQRHTTTHTHTQKPKSPEDTTLPFCAQLCTHSIVCATDRRFHINARPLTLPSDPPLSGVFAGMRGPDVTCTDLGSVSCHREPDAFSSPATRNSRGQERRLR